MFNPLPAGDQPPTPICELLYRRHGARLEAASPGSDEMTYCETRWYIAAAAAAVLRRRGRGDVLDRRGLVITRQLIGPDASDEPLVGGWVRRLDRLHGEPCPR